MRFGMKFVNLILNKMNKNKIIILIIGVLLFSFVGTKDILAITINNRLNFNWVPNGSVNSIAVATNTVYIGGNFTYLGPYKGNAFIVNSSQGSASDLVDKIDGIVWSAISDGNGGWFIGGDFNRVGNCQIAKLIYIDSSGRVNCNFNLGIDDTVYAMALKDNILFIGGAFERVLNFNRKYLVAIDISDLNNPQLINTFSFEPEDYVFSLVVHPNTNTLYVGGQFVWIKNLITNITSNKKFLASINYSTSATSTINETFSTSINDVVWTMLLSPDNSKLYVGGYFTTPTKYIAALNPTNGSSISGFNPANNNLDYAVLALEYNDFNTPTTNDDYLYIGGRFASPAIYLTALNANTGAIISSFSSSINKDDNDVDSVLALALDKTNNRLYVGGSFNNQEPFYLMSVNATSGGRITSFNLTLNDRVNVLKIDNNRNLFVGGRFYSYGGVRKKYLAAFDTNLNLKNDFNIEPNQPVDVLLYNPNNKYLYVAGPFTQIGTQTRTFFAAINTADNNNILSSFNYTFSTTTGDFISALALDKNRNHLYLCGYFYKINNSSTYRFIARINSNDGSLDPAFSPQPNDIINDCQIDEQTRILYVAGRFNQIYNTTSRYLAALDTTNNRLITEFNPQINDIVSTIALDPEDNLIFIGGRFTLPNQYFAILNKTTGQAVNILGYQSPNLPVIKIKNDKNNNVLFVSGHFTELIYEIKRGLFIANYTPSNLNITNILIYPEFNIYDINFSTSAQRLYLGGNFESLYFNGDNSQNFFYKNLALFNYTTEEAANNPLPQLNSIIPTSTLVNQTGDINLRLLGNNFIPNSQVLLNNNTLPVSYISATELRANITRSLIATSGIYQIKVYNPPPGGGYSNIVNFTVFSPTPQINSIYPTSSQVNVLNDINLIINGNNFVNGAVVVWNNSNALRTTFVSSTQITAIIPTNFLSRIGTYTISVVNPSPCVNNNCISNTVNFYVIPEPRENYGVEISPNNIIVYEGGQGNSYNIRLTAQPSSDVIINLNYNPSQITVNTSTLIFTPLNWQSNQRINVNAVDDNIIENNHSTIISHSISSTDLNYNNIPISGVRVDIIDNDRSSQPPGTGGGGGGGGTGGGGETARQEEREGQDEFTNQLFLLLSLLTQGSTSTTSTQETESGVSGVCLTKYKDFDFEYIKNKIPRNFRFPLKTLRLGMINKNIKYLQIILNSNDKTLIAKSGPGSKNRETFKYGIGTTQAMKKFQRLYLNAKRPSGISGVNTIKIVNQILDCAFK